MEINIRNLNKNYYSDGKTIAALAGVDLTIPANRIFTLLGPSGCGKTTLLRCIVGLEMPDSGRLPSEARSFFQRKKTSMSRRRKGAWGWCSRPMRSGPT